VKHGATGLLASSEQDWFTGLSSLLESAELRQQLGEAGRRRVLERFDRRVIVPRFVSLLEELLRGEIEEAG
jgi:glycosyltransferase involved in cell wall biosynthesis